MTKVKKELHQDLIKAEIRAYENGKIDITLLLSEEDRDKYLLNNGDEYNYKRVFRRIEVNTLR